MRRLEPLTGQAETCDAQHNPYFRYNNPSTRRQISELVSNSVGSLTIRTRRYSGIYL